MLRAGGISLFIFSLKSLLKEATKPDEQTLQLYSGLWPLSVSATARVGWKERSLAVLTQ